MSPSARSPASKRSKSQHSDDEDFEMLNGSTSDLDDDDVVDATPQKMNARVKRVRKIVSYAQDSEEEEEEEEEYSDEEEEESEGDDDDDDWP